tara:strand:+ start:33620 stop:33802 length:183 start_codon:yes stop_codon:yes gene_type:complete
MPAFIEGIPFIYQNQEEPVFLAFFKYCRREKNGVLLSENRYIEMFPCFRWNLNLKYGIAS